LCVWPRVKMETTALKSTKKFTHGQHMQTWSEFKKKKTMQHSHHPFIWPETWHHAFNLAKFQFNSNQIRWQTTL
jgi:hypothetical protein